MNLQSISDNIEVISNFPKEGIYFRDISPLLANHDAREMAFNMMYDLLKNLNINYVAGIESRGFIFGIALSQRLKCDFVMLRKSKLNIENSINIDYGLENVKNTLCVQQNVLKKGSNVLIVDDILSTGGSLIAGCELIENIGCHAVGCSCLIELLGIQKKNKLNKYKIFSLLKYSTNESSKFISKHDQLYNAKKIEYFPLEYPFLDDDRIIVFSSPSMKTIANNIVSKSIHFRSGSIHWNYFPDGYPNIKFEHLKYLENRKIVFIISLYDKSYILEQLSMMMVLSRQFIESLDIVIPYFAPGTMERVEEEGTLATAEITAKIIASGLPLTKNGVPIIHIFDLHTLHNRFYFPDTVFVRMETGIDLLLRKISPNATIVFPDEGAFKRFGSMFSKFKIMICHKIRNNNTTTIKIVNKLNWPNDDSNCLNDVIIVDDLVQSGKTLEECRKALVEIGAKKISAYVTHAIFPKKNYRNFINGGFHKFYVTNTIPEITSIIEKHSPFEVLHIEDILIERFKTSFKLKENLSNKMITVNIYVASTNNTKLNSTYIAINTYLKKKFISKRIDVNVFGVAVPSDVHEQPIENETLTGCENRLNNLIKYVKHYNYKYDVLVSIENGINKNEETGNDPYDFCVTQIMCNDEKFTTISSHKTYVPRKFVDASMAQNQNVTVGNLIEQEFGLNSGCWHEKFGELTREEDIVNTLSFNFFKNDLGGKI